MARRQKQSTLFNLGGVVNVKEVKEQRDALKDPRTALKEKLEILSLWARKKPSTDVLIQTGIGKTVKKLAKDPENPEELRAEAEKVYRGWKSEVEKRERLKERGPLEVQCDLDTRHWRNKAKRLLREVLEKDGALFPQSRVPVEAKIEAVERELFNFCRHLIQNRYRVTVRNLVFALKKSADLRKSVFLEATTSPRQFIRDHHAY